jgi:hypothetical protein
LLEQLSDAPGRVGGAVDLDVAIGNVAADFPGDSRGDGF